MTEARQMAALVVIALVMATIGIGASTWLPSAIEGDLVIDEYIADFGDDGSLTERYTYEVKSSGGYRMLFRFWDEPLSTTPLDQAHVEFMQMIIPPGTIGYIKDHTGEVQLFGAADPSYAAIIGSLAELNEVGIYRPDYFEKGIYSVEYRYVLHPTIEYDEHLAHLNIRLVDEHIPYRNIVISYPATHVEAAYPHPPSLRVTWNDGMIEARGSLGKNEGLGIELLLSLAALDEIEGYAVQIDDVQGRTEAANPWSDILPYYAASVLYLISMVMVVLLPMILVLIYFWFGREKRHTVPDYLSFTPNPDMKPWAVNLLFKGDPMIFDHDGYYATLLDLHRRGVIRIVEKGESVSIYVRPKTDEPSDPYEKRVLGFLSEMAVDGVVDSEDLKRLADEAKGNSYAESRILRYQRGLSEVTRDIDPELIDQYVVNGRWRVAPLLVGAVLTLIASIVVLVTSMHLIDLLLPAVALSALWAIGSGAALASPSSLFGRWKGDGYRERLEWIAFSRFLSDLAMMRKYSPGDISMWGEWLVYGTALGVGDNVVRAMEDLRIRMPEAVAPQKVRVAFVPIVRYIPPSATRVGGGFGGGGSFGGGGGFGGGGVGGR